MGVTPLENPENPDFDFSPACFFTPSEVKEVAEEISKISKAEFQARFNPSELVVADIYPPIVWQRGEEDNKYLINYFLLLVKFF